MIENTFHLTAAVMALATVVGLVALRLRQPLIVAFLLVGVLVGPSVLGWVGAAEPLELLAKIGIAVLLFLVGLKLDLHLVRTTGSVAVVTGLGQVAFTSGIGFLLAWALGMDPTAALYVAVALTFSSTIIIVKLLSDKRELEQLHGRIALGFLIVQDIVVVVVMIVLATVGSGSGDALVVDLALSLVRAVALALGLAVMMRWVLPWALHRIARSQELLVVGAVAWAVAMAALSDALGFSTEIGAFLAGFALASTPFREAIGSALTPLRDFLLLFFFIELGSQLDLGLIGAEVPAAVVLSLFVLIGNPLIVLVIMGVMGYRKRVGFLAGLTVAQISEFSLIFVALGRSLGHIGDSTVGLVTLVGLITIGLSTYLILYSHRVYEWVAPALSVFERARPTRDEEPPPPQEVDVILYGMGRYGANLATRLLESGHSVLAVDWDPHAALADPRHPRLRTVFGDADDPEYPGSLPLAHTRVVVSTIPDVATSSALVAALRRWGFDGPVALTAHTPDDAERLRALSADLVLEPFADAADDGARQLAALVRPGPGRHQPAPVAVPEQAPGGTGHDH
jgi:Kef-type K+ transport system membrane component KefB